MHGERPHPSRVKGLKVVEQCALNTVLNKAIGKLSRGFRQRVGMANVLFA